MEDKTANKLILITVLIIIALVLLYAYKISIGSENVPNISTNMVEENITIETEEENSVIQTTNTITVNTITEANQTIIIPSVNESTQSNTTKITSNSTSTYAYNNKYYYNQLDSYSKAIYDAIVDNIGNLKYGSYTINIDYDFSGLLSQSGGQDKLNEYYNDAINAVNLDIPNLFYIDFSKMYLNVESTTTVFGTTYTLYIDTNGYSTYYASGYSSQSQIENAISEIDSIKNEVCSSCTGDDYSKIKTAHDWLIEYMSYDSSSYNSGNVYGAFIEKKGVCEAYSRAYKYILDTLGITNILVTGEATNSNGSTENHIWNYVKLNGTWYAVDVTWDDPVVYGGGTVSSGTKHKYFLLGSTEISKNHVVSYTISSSGKTFTLPTLSTENY